jgi:hypothetical protein
MACLQSSPAAFEQRSAFVNPLDGKNLNRSFPGDPRCNPRRPAGIYRAPPARRVTVPAGGISGLSSRSVQASHP